MVYIICADNTGGESCVDKKPPLSELAVRSVPMAYRVSFQASPPSLLVTLHPSVRDYLNTCLVVGSPTPSKIHCGNPGLSPFCGLAGRKPWGFGSIAHTHQNRDGAWIFRLERMGDQGIVDTSGTLNAIYRSLNFYEGVSTSKDPQVLTLYLTTGSGEQRAHLKAVLSQVLCNWLDGLERRECSKIAKAMSAAAQSIMLGNEEVRGPSPRIQVDADGGKFFSLETLTGFMYVRMDHVDEGNGYTLEGGNMDSFLQQIAFVSALAVLSDAFVGRRK